MYILSIKSTKTNLIYNVFFTTIKDLFQAQTELLNAKDLFTFTARSGNSITHTVQKRRGRPPVTTTTPKRRGRPPLKKPTNETTT